MRQCDNATPSHVSFISLCVLLMYSITAAICFIEFSEEDFFSNPVCPLSNLFFLVVGLLNLRCCAYIRGQSVETVELKFLLVKTVDAALWSGVAPRCSNLC